ncbi:hypothetical protein [Parvimonas micra]|uniref:hypothetical protein n=1 Tax=Parvimonas micra TaxID=33033 RepID=UPI00241FAC89|nr:hypothetical protein [Parvimonas micra]
MKLTINWNLNGRIKVEELTNCQKIELLTLSKGLKILHNDTISIAYIDIENGDSWVIEND